MFGQEQGPWPATNLRMTSLIPKQVRFVSHHFLSPVQPLWLQKYLKVPSLGEKGGRKGPDIREVWPNCIWAGEHFRMVLRTHHVLREPTPVETEGLSKLSPAEEGHAEHMDRM